MEKKAYTRPTIDLLIMMLEDGVASGSASLTPSNGTEPFEIQENWQEDNSTLEPTGW